MKYSFKKINIEAPFPTTQCGHSCQTYLVDEYRDHLYARVTALKDDNNWIIHYSFDLLAFDQKSRHLIQDYLRQYYQDDNIHVITSTTHTHYANSVRDDKYDEYLLDLLKQETITMNYIDIDNVTSTYQVVHCQDIGKSRISGYETNNEYLALIRLYENNNNFYNLIYYNCHPTILVADTKYFSAEYPGYVLQQLEQQYPNINFSYIQGAAGDISSRFTRSGNDYNALTQLADKLLLNINKLMNTEVNKIPLTLNYHEVNIPYEHEFTPIDLSNIRNELSERELETIKIGQQQREKLENSGNELFGKLIKDADVASLDLGSVKLIFFPNEIFSEYINYIDINHELLVSYSNGYGPYVLPIDFQYITYEMFMDTLTKKSKETIIETIKTI